MSELQKTLDRHSFQYFVLIQYMQDKIASDLFKEYFEKNDLPVLIYHQLSKAFLEGYKHGANMAKAKKAVKKPAKKGKK